MTHKKRSTAHKQTFPNCNINEYRKKQHAPQIQPRSKVKTNLAAQQEAKGKAIAKVREEIDVIVILWWQ